MEKQEEILKEDIITEEKTISNEKEFSENLEENDINEEKVETKKEKRNKEKERIAHLEEEVKQYKNEYLKAYAEMENTKRRLKEESIKDRKYASQGLVSNLLTPIDMLMKVVNMETANPEINNFLIGFKMISNQITEVLKNDGLKEIESLNKDFDPVIHEAIEKVKCEGVESNKVVEVLQVGYMYKDRVIKPAMVKVSE